MSSEATKGQTPDIYGQVHPIETQDLIQTKLKEFQDHVSQIPDKTALMKALEKCPDQLTDEFKIMFLRAEVFNADVSVHEWDRVPILTARTIPHSLSTLACCETICHLLGTAFGIIRRREGLSKIEPSRSLA